MTAALAEPPVTKPSAASIDDGCVAILRTLRHSRPGWRARADIERLVDWGERDAVLVRLVARGWAERTGGKGDARYRITVTGRVWLHEAELDRTGIETVATLPAEPGELTLVEALAHLEGRVVEWRGGEP